MQLGREFEKLENLALPCATQMLLPCSPNFPHASITLQTHAKIVKMDKTLDKTTKFVSYLSSY